VNAEGNAAKDNPSRPKVGDWVKLSPSGDLNGCLSHGEFGKIQADHQNERPYLVSFNDDSYWYAEKDVVRPPHHILRAAQHKHTLEYTTYGYVPFCNGCNKPFTECEPSTAGTFLGYRCPFGSKCTSCKFNLCLKCSGATDYEGLVVLRHYRGLKKDLTLGSDNKLTFVGRLCTAVSDTCGASKGKWWYEVTILSAVNCTQFGWADAHFEPNEERSENGTGDDASSWAADGFFVYKWHDGKHEHFGNRWNKGDVVGIAIDLDSDPNSLLFGVNGDWGPPHGVAFEGISFRSYLYPALSAQRRTKVRVNFGQTGFAFSPPSGDTSFKPWHSAPKL
jgi:hypothetical protein